MNHEKKVLLGDSTLQMLQEIVEIIAEEHKCYLYKELGFPSLLLTLVSWNNTI